MSPETSTINASQAVERIREIIVGRHLERLEQRVARLENSDAPASISRPDFQDRVLVAEAKIEALHDSVSRLTDGTREELSRHTVLQRDEIQRLAHQIQQFVASQAFENQPSQAIEQLEHRLGGWLSDWKQAVQNHLENRDHQIAAYIQSELKTVRTAIDQRIDALEARQPDFSALDLRFNKIAEAARAFADSISELPPLPLADANPP
jgi:hypothetical protein